MKKTYAKNKKAYHDYEIEQTFEAGISLLGIEVKSIQLAKVSIKESYISIKGTDVFWKQGHISLLESKDSFTQVENVRDRRLLLHKTEIKKIREAIEKEGYTCVPLELYKEDYGKLKLSIGIAKGKKLYDKRQALKEKDIKRETERSLK